MKKIMPWLLRGALHKQHMVKRMLLQRAVPACYFEKVALCRQAYCLRFSA
jgi:hypothetical protein